MHIYVQMCACIRMWHLPLKTVYLSVNAYIICMQYLSRDCIFMGKCICVVSVSKECTGATYNRKATSPGRHVVCTLLLYVRIGAP